jgi:hypothetical protein
MLLSNLVQSYAPSLLLLLARFTAVLSFVAAAVELLLKDSASSSGRIIRASRVVAIILETGILAVSVHKKRNKD